MKKKFVSLALCMALLSSFTLSASAEFNSSDSTTLSNVYKQLTDIRNELGYPGGGYSSLRAAINYIANNLPSSPKDYSTVLSSIKSNTDSMVSSLSDIYKVNSGLVQRVIEVGSEVMISNQHLGTISSSLGVIDSHIGSGFELNHSDLTSFATQNHSDLSSLLTFFDETFTTRYLGPESEYSNAYRFQLYDYDNDVFYRWYTLGGLIIRYFSNFTCDTPIFSGRPSLYGVVHQLQKVLASDDDLKLKQDNKANEDAATDAFVNGNSSKTSLGTGDIGNLKDVGGTFNDLTSLNGQSSVSSFLSGLASADGTGQGWFSEANRASLDAVSTPVTTTRLVQKTWRGEKSLTYSISADTSVNVVASPAPARAPAADPDPYNMAGFEDNYNWLWGDAS